MNRLFIELYLDEDVSVLVKKLVEARGFAATTALDQGRLGKTDVEQLAFAVSCQRTLLTHNRIDFEALFKQYLAAAQTHYGIIIAVRHPPHEIVRRLLTILNQVTADEMENQLRYIRGIRISHLFAGRLLVKARDQLHPDVAPHVSHLQHAPLRINVSCPHSLHGSPS
jgi:Domain of unknown function (DUF5615)